MTFGANPARQHNKQPRQLQSVPWELGFESVDGTRVDSQLDLQTLYGSGWRWLAGRQLGSGTAGYLVARSFGEVTGAQLGMA